MSLFQVGAYCDGKARQNYWQPGSNRSRTFGMNDFKKDFGELKVRGVKFDELEPTEYPWGLVATSRRPEGDDFSVVQQPALTSW